MNKVRLLYNTDKIQNTWSIHGVYKIVLIFDSLVRKGTLWRDKQESVIHVTALLWSTVSFSFRMF
jgi:hypothetical protein